MLYLTNSRFINKDESHLRKLLREKEMVKNYYKCFPNTNHYVRILHLNSEISFYKRKLSQNNLTLK
jgi:hypothetical protein